MKVAFFVCILFLLFFIIHTKLQKSIELQVLEVHDTYLILQDLKFLMTIGYIWLEKNLRILMSGTWL